MRLRRPEAEFDDIDMTPMIDIIFQLVIFFMIAGTFVKEEFFRITVPKAATAEVTSLEKAFTVLVTADGLVAPAGAKGSQDRYESLTELVRDLREYSRAMDADRQSPVVVVKGDGNVNYRRVVHVWNAIRKAGIAEVSFQVAPER